MLLDDIRKDHIIKDDIMGRQLASIQKVKEINAISGADSIEVCSVLGWKVVTRKGEFKKDELVIYVEIDSLLPIREEFEFLRKNCYKKNENGEGFRIKTIRLKGQISQGICFPLNILAEKLEKGVYTVKEGEDVTEVLEITKYIPAIPAELKGLVKGQFPSFIPKTDETRVQVLQDVLTRHKDKKCYVTEKVDGASVTYFVNKGEFGVCSRNLELSETEGNALWKFARENKIEEKLKALGTNIAIQGELIGVGIQKNNLRLPETKVLFFNVFNIDAHQYLDCIFFQELIKKLELETVPVLEIGYSLEDNIDKLVEKSKGFSALNSKVFREGIVIRPLKEELDMHMANGFGNGRLTFKAINPEYLLKYDE
ncbi:MAG: RNA ligase (ATP) [Candidatus Methanoperedens sp.]|nr:RNA ligase (ATP) [Candidatus Methanoperedens sp.]